MAVLAFMFAAASASPSEPGRVTQPPAPHIYLYPLAGQCDRRESADEIVVCGDTSADEAFRLRPIDGQKFQDKPLRAETKLGGGTIGVNGGRATVGGFPSNRVMVTIKIPS